MPLLVAALCVPMALDLAEPNGLYGVRTAATRASEAAWYRANRAAGIAGIAAGVIGFAVNLMVLRSRWPAGRKLVAWLAVLVAVTVSISATGYAAD